jgi:hypothetical protein
MRRRAGAAGWALAGLLGVGLGVVALLPPVPQDPAYHRLADARPLLGVPHGLNVLSNAAFVAAGLLGLCRVRPPAPGRRTAVFGDPRERWPWAAFFAALALTGLGSAWYHLAPDSERLVWDRLPLAAAAMGLLAALVTDRVHVGLGLALFPPLVGLGTGSVLYWIATERAGAGDLRPYGLVQFYPVGAVPLLLALAPPRYTRGGELGLAAGLYGAAKGFEALDAPVFALGQWVSGHTLKHLVAGAAGLVLAGMLGRRRPVADAAAAGAPGPKGPTGAGEGRP